MITDEVMRAAAAADRRPPLGPTLGGTIEIVSGSTNVLRRRPRLASLLTLATPHILTHSVGLSAMILQCGYVFLCHLTAR